LPSIDMPLNELWDYRPPLTRPEHFEAYWSEGFAAMRAQPVKADIRPIPYSADGIELSEVRLPAFGGGTIVCKLMKPIGKTSLPTIIFYHGYSCAMPTPFQLLPWACLGYAVLGVDCRGQGGDSTDGAIYPGGHRPGFMTQGIERAKEYYYRYLYLDSVRSLDWMAGQPFVDMSRIAITGVSQGGGLTLAVAGLSNLPKLAISEVPFLCHFRRSVELSPAYPYKEIADWLRQRPELGEQVWRTLGYVDCMNLTGRIRCKTYVTVGLWDEVCPPSGIFAAYNNITVERQLFVYEFMAHESPVHFNETRFEIIRLQL
jgi:cephalosporin-C deacetylase